MEEHSYEYQKLQKENYLLVEKVLQLESQLKDVKSYVVLLNKQKHTAEKKLKEIQQGFQDIIDIPYEEGD